MAAVTEAKSPASAAGEPAGLHARGESPVAFERRGWSAAAEPCEPKIVALASLATLAPPPAVPAVNYVSRGNVLVIAGSQAAPAHAAAAELAKDLHVTLLAPAPGEATAGVSAWSGSLESLEGHLG